MSPGQVAKCSAATAAVESQKKQRCQESVGRAGSRKSRYISRRLRQVEKGSVSRLNLRSRQMGRGLLPSVRSPANPLAGITELSHSGSHRLAEIVSETHIRGPDPRVSSMQTALT